MTSIHDEPVRGAMATSSMLVISGGVRELMKGRLPEEILAEASGSRLPG